MSTSKQVVRTERRGPVLVITLDRPDARNAVDGAVARGLEAAIDRLEAEADLQVGVLAAAGPVFSAGADLKLVGAGDLDGMGTARGGFAGIVRRARTKPLIAAVHSDALAGGFEIALACDLIVAAEGARMGLPEVRWSLVAIGGGLVHLAGIVGRNVALELALTGVPMANERLFALGVINRLVPADAVLSTALELAGAIAANGPLAVQASRRIVLEGLDLDTDGRWALGDAVGLPVFASEDAKEGPRAFLEKRRPKWKGR